MTVNSYLSNNIVSKFRVPPFYAFWFSTFIGFVYHVIYTISKKVMSGIYTTGCITTMENIKRVRVNPMNNNPQDSIYSTLSAFYKNYAISFTVISLPQSASVSRYRVIKNYFLEGISVLQDILSVKWCCINHTSIIAQAGGVVNG